MKKIIQMCLLLLSCTSFFSSASVLEFRLDQDRLWLNATNEPLAQLLKHFLAAGVDVQIDPSAQKLVTGTYTDRDVESALDALLSPFNYRLDWRREPGPLGPLTQLTGIRVFRNGNADAVKPLHTSRRIETSFDGRSRFLAREILIGFGAGASIENLHAFLTRTGGTVISANTDLGIYRILLPEGSNVPDLAAQFRNDKSLALAEPNYVLNLPQLLPTAAESSRGPGIWSAPSGETRIAVSVLDSGLAPDDNLNRAVISSFDATRPGEKLTTDPIGHGTLMAQLAAGLLDPFNTPVGEGIPVVAVKAFPDDGTADSFTLMNAMTYAVNHSVGPISLSWGSETPSQFIEAAVQYVLSKNRPVFAAVGNENTGRPIYPAAYPGVTGVAASQGDVLADYSNRGDFVDLIAPGAVGGSQGTSIATAYVSHVAALYMQHHPAASAQETVAALKTAAGSTGFLTEAAVKQLLSK